MKKILTIALIAVLVVCALLLVACDKDKKADDTTTAASTTAAKTTKAKTTAEPTTEEVTTEAVTTAFPAELLEVMPKTLPDGKEYEVKYRMDMSTNIEDWKVSGRSANCGNYKFEGVQGIYGQGLSIGLVDETAWDGKTHRAEVDVEPDFAVNLKGITGIMWWVDFTNTTPQEGKAGSCCSVTQASIRSNKGTNLSAGYYFQDGAWRETKNVNVCRMEVPNQFRGWVYVPAISYRDNNDQSAVLVDDNGNFLDIDVFHFNLYTDYYDQNDPNTQIIFDEIMWVVAK